MNAPDWRTLPPLSALRAFECAARLGSFAAASRALSVTPPAVAQQVRGLEEHLGLTLFRRSGRGQVLTEAGADFASRLGAGFSALAEAVQSVRRTETQRGLRVTTTSAFARNALLPRLERFWAEHPGITVSIQADNAIVDLAAQGFDIGIRACYEPGPGVVAEHLLHSRKRLVAAPRLVAGNPPLASLPWIIDLHDPIDRSLLTAVGLDPDALTVRDIPDGGLAIDAACAGYGLLFATNEIVADAMAEGRLVEVSFPDLPVATYWVVTPPGPRSAAVESFVAWLHRDVAEHPR